MASGRLSEREQALIDAARRELGSRRTAPRPGPAEAAPALTHTTPLDEPTVLGWDHPVAATAPPRVKVADPGEDKWAQVASLLEAERRSEAERRETLRRRAMYVLLALAVAMLAFVLLALRR